MHDLRSPVGVAGLGVGPLTSSHGDCSRGRGWGHIAGILVLVAGSHSDNHPGVDQGSDGIVDGLGESSTQGHGGHGWPAAVTFVGHKVDPGNHTLVGSGSCIAENLGVVVSIFVVGRLFGVWN